MMSDLCEKFAVGCSYWGGHLAAQMPDGQFVCDAQGSFPGKWGINTQKEETHQDVGEDIDHQHRGNLGRNSGAMVEDLRQLSFKRMFYLHVGVIVSCSWIEAMCYKL